MLYSQETEDLKVDLNYDIISSQCIFQDLLHPRFIVLLTQHFHMVSLC